MKEISEYFLEALKNYKDNKENRKLGRVGKEYNGLKRGSLVMATLQDGKTIEARFKEYYSNGKYILVYTDDKKEYLVKPENVIKKTELSLNKINSIQLEIKKLKQKRKQIELDMEDELSNIGDEINNGNNYLVKKYAKELDNIDNKISNLENKLK